MKLRNKKTGDIVKVNNLNAFVHTDEETIIYNSLAELNEEWEDVPEEPKKQHFYIEPRGQVIELVFGDDVDELKEELSEIGNYFSSREEAEKAVEKLKAYKRLKDKGFRFDGWNVGDNGKGATIFANYPSETRADLDLLFGGEDE